MCNIPLIGSLIAAAQASFATAIVLVAAAGAMNGNVFRAWGAPAAMIGAAILIGLAITSLVAASRAAANCAAACGAATVKITADIAAFITALATLTILVGAATVLSAIPFAARGAIAAILAGLSFAGVLSTMVTTDLAALSACAAKAPALPPPVSTIVSVLNPLLVVVIGAAVVGGVASGVLPLVPVLLR